MSSRKGGRPGITANVKIETSAAAAAIPRIRSPIPPTPASGGPKPSPRFGANSAWKHFFQMVSLGGGPRTHEEDLSHQRTKSAGDVKAMDDEATNTPQPAIHLPLLSQSTHGQLEKIFSMLRGRVGDYIMRERLEEFLIETQGGLVRPLEKDIYTLGDFVYIWLHDYSKALRPAGKKDLSKPISNYFISSSHNTYIGLGNQLNGEVSAEAYRTVLSENCRCVEIDVWNGEGSTETGPRTPSRSRSPRPSERDTARTHKRQFSNMSTLSTSSIPAAAQSLVDIMDDKWRELTGAKREGKRNRSRSPRPTKASASMSQLQLTLPIASHSTSSLDNDLLDPNDIGGSQLRHVKSAESLRFLGRKSRSRSRSASKERGRKIEPDVTHAHTVQGLGDVGLARRIPLREVCRVIKESAFKTNKLPIIVSLEVHATGEQQDMMVDIMKEEWGDHLLDDRLTDCDPNERQPRLEELMEKILVKVKRPASHGFVHSSKGSSQLTVPMIDDDGSASEDERVFADDILTLGGEVTPGVKKAKTKIRDALGRLAIYTHSEHYKDFSGPAAKSLTHIFSIDEYKILKLHQTKHREMFIHNRQYFMRAYPHSTRVNSTNLDPSLYWRKGVQMVALNWQRSHVDEAMMLNSAMFESEQGWVLKPEGYLSDDITITQAQAGHHRTLKRFRITILAAQFIPFPGATEGASDASSISSVSTADSTDFRPFVKCELHVETPEERNEKKAIKSGLVQDGQYKLVSKCSETENPDWGVGQVLEFPPNIDNVVEELSFVRLKIEDEGLVKDRLAAWACIRLDRLQQGYRFIDLKDAYGKPSAGKLLVKIEKEVR